MVHALVPFKCNQTSAVFVELGNSRRLGVASPEFRQHHDFVFGGK